jgi:Bacterial lipocalin
MGKFTFILLSVAVIMLSSCASIPKGATSVESFDVNRYLGKWYEIARFDFSFEKDMDNTTAEYSLNNDGTIRVENTGYNYKKNKWEKAIGKARFRGSKSLGEIEVSFFGPFYGGYNVIMLDAEYKYALIAGSSINYLWILSREKSIPDEIRNKYLEEAKRIGYKTENLIWVKHDK